MPKDTPPTPEIPLPSNPIMLKDDDSAFQKQTPSPKPPKLIIPNSRPSGAPRSASGSVQAMVERLERAMTPESPPGGPHARSFSSPVAGRVKGLAKKVGGLVRRGDGGVSDGQREGENVEGQNNTGGLLTSPGRVASVGEQGNSVGENQANFDCSSVYSQDNRVDTAKGNASEDTAQQCLRDTKNHPMSMEGLESRKANASSESARKKITTDILPAQHQPSTPKTRTQIPVTPPNIKHARPEATSDRPASSPVTCRFSFPIQPASPPASHRRNPGNVAF